MGEREVCGAAEGAHVFQEAAVLAEDGQEFLTCLGIKPVPDGVVAAFGLAGRRPGAGGFCPGLPGADFLGLAFAFFLGPAAHQRVNPSS